MRSNLLLALTLSLPLSICGQQPGAPAAPPTKVTTVAEEQPTRADILRLFRAMRLEKQMEGIQKMMLAQMPAMLESTEGDEMKSLAPEQRERLRALAESSMQDANKLYPISEMLDDFVPIYQHNLTKSDVRRITAFYLSPSGKKLLDQNPQMMQEAMTVIAPKMQERMLKLLEEEKRKADGIVDENPAQPQQSEPPQPPH